MSIKQYQCISCGDTFTARVADRKRGWAKFCSKSCKATEQEKRTGQYAAHQTRQSSSEDHGDFDGGWDEHKSWVV